MNKKILVTGGLGYIGSHVVVELQNEGFQVIVIDNLSNSSMDVLDRIIEITGITPLFEKIDLRDKNMVSDFFKRHSDIYGVIHFAASKAVGESTNNPLKYYDNNISPLVYILQQLEKIKDQNFIFSSSCTVYGQADKSPITEDTLLKKAESPYGNTKKIGELPIGIPQNLVPFVTQTGIGIRDELSIFGKDYPTPDGTCIRDYIHVVDLAKAHVAAMTVSYTHLTLPTSTTV